VVIGIASPFVLSVGIRKGSVYSVQYPGLFKALYTSNNQICSVEYHINVSLQNVLNHVEINAQMYTNVHFFLWPQYSFKPLHDLEQRRLNNYSQRSIKRYRIQTRVHNSNSQFHCVTAIIDKADVDSCEIRKCVTTQCLQMVT